MKKQDVLQLVKKRLLIEIGPRVFPGKPTFDRERREWDVPLLCFPPMRQPRGSTLAQVGTAVLDERSAFVAFPTREQVLETLAEPVLPRPRGFSTVVARYREWIKDVWSSGWLIWREARFLKHIDPGWRQPLPPGWLIWAETLADAVLTALNASESDHRLGSLERARFAPRSQEHDWTADVLSIIQHEVLPFLQTCQPSGSPAAIVRSLTSAQRAHLVARVQRRAHRLCRSVAEERRLMETLTRCLLREPREGENVQAEP